MVPGQSRRGTVISIFTRRRLDSIGNSLLVGTQDLGLWVAELTGYVRYAVRQRPLLTLAATVMVGFVVGFFLRRRVADRGIGR